jgi:HEAT repeat protein
MSPKISAKKRDEDDIKFLISQFRNKSGLMRKKARIALKLFGHKAVELLSELLVDKEKIIRWEAVKTLLEIRDPHSGSLFLLAIKDEEPDVRWVAAEGLISLGKSGVITILEGLISNIDSMNVRKGAHHVLKEFSKNNPSPELNKLLSTLTKADSELFSPMVALKFLRKLREESKRN